MGHTLLYSTLFTFRNTCLVQADFTIWYLTCCTRLVPPRTHCPKAEQTSSRPTQLILCPAQLPASLAHGLVTDHLAAWPRPQCSTTLSPPSWGQSGCYGLRQGSQTSSGAGRPNERLNWESSSTRCPDRVAVRAPTTHFPGLLGLAQFIWNPIKD